MLPLFNTETLELPLLRDAVPTVTNDRLPAPSVWMTWPALPPVIATLATAPRLAGPVTERFAVVTLPLELITVVDGYSPTEKPAIEFNGLIDILYVPFVLVSPPLRTVIYHHSANKVINILYAISLLLSGVTLNSTAGGILPELYCTKNVPTPSLMYNPEYSLF